MSLVLFHVSLKKEKIAYDKQTVDIKNKKEWLFLCRFGANFMGFTGWRQTIWTVLFNEFQLILYESKFDFDFKNLTSWTVVCLPKLVIFFWLNRLLLLMQWINLTFWKSATTTVLWTVPSGERLALGEKVRLFYCSTKTFALELKWIW